MSTVKSYLSQRVLDFIHISQSLTAQNNLLLEQNLFPLQQLMARGGHSHGRSHGGHHHGHHHMHHGGRGMSNSGAVFRAQIDSISNNIIPPTIVGGVYTLQGNQINVASRLNQPLQYPSPMMPMQGMPMTVQMSAMNLPMMPSQPQAVSQANITVAGNQTSFGSDCCFILTIILGSFIIFPLCFMCCMWWKKIVFPRYQVTPDFYRALGTFLRRERQITMLNLTVVDNSFNAQKARILYESLQGTSLMGFTFRNIALACNHNQSQADSFLTSMTPLKSLPFPVQITWDDMIL